MTSRELYEYALIELNKIEAPSLLLEDYNYFINKAVQQYINLVYAKLEVDQQSTDDIRVLKASTILKPNKITSVADYKGLEGGMFDSTYYVDLPPDYTHLLNCIVEYKVGISNFKCYNKGDTVYFAARRLTPDMYTQILNNAYMRPMYKRPYYYLNNINTTNTGVLPTNATMDSDVLTANGIDSASTADKAAYYTALQAYDTALATYNADKTAANKTSLDTAITNLNNAKENIKGSVPAATPTSSLVDAYNSQGDRLANPSVVRLELRYGKDDGVFTPNNVYVDYLKAPMYIRLTQEQINSTLDYSQVLEFPDYVCFEIANIFVRLLMENASDPRLQTNMPINSTIAAPAAIQAAQQQAQ
jgi:hypothetical protein